MTYSNNVFSAYNGLISANPFDALPSRKAKVARIKKLSRYYRMASGNAIFKNGRKLYPVKAN